MAVAFFIGLALGAAGCSDATEPGARGPEGSAVADRDAAEIDEAHLPADLTLSVLSETAQPPTKLAIEVLLSRKVTEHELRTVASVLRAKDRAAYQRVFIQFFVPGMKANEGAWALAQFDPKLKVTLFGATLDLEERVAASRPLGSWIDDRSVPARTLTLLRFRGQPTMRERFPDGTTIDAILEESSLPDGRCLRERESQHGTYFVLRPDRVLEVRQGQSTMASLRPTVQDDTVVGQWMQNSSPGRVLTLIESRRQFRMLQQFNDGSDVEDEVKVTDRPNGRNVRARSWHEGDYFVICPNGELESCDAQGVIVRLSRFE